VTYSLGHPVFAGADWAAWQLALTKWAGWSAGQVGRHVKCWSRTYEEYSW